MDILKAEIVVMDGNLPSETLSYVLELCYQSEIPGTSCWSTPQLRVWFEPTSVAKSRKIAVPELLRKVTYISPNIDEAIGKHMYSNYTHITEIAKQLNPSLDTGSRGQCVSHGN